ncbi:hypothetical protein KBB89_00395 [Candidatus Gracilibacteria bacterium]|nr:hypothetical protein [Candidatus Gracilibacteria bacterium]
MIDYSVPGLEDFSHGRDDRPLQSFYATIDQLHAASLGYGINPTGELEAGKNRIAWQLDNLKTRLKHPYAERVYDLLEAQGCDIHTGGAELGQSLEIKQGLSQMIEEMQKSILEICTHKIVKPNSLFSDSEIAA